MVQNAVYVLWNWVELASSELEWELNCLQDLVPDSELEWNCLYRNWNWIAKTELTPALAVGQVIGVHDVDSIYRVPLLLEEQNLVEFFAERLNLPLPKLRPRRYLVKWKDLVDR